MTLRILAGAGLAIAPALAQFPPQIPYEQTSDLIVVDSGFDGVYRFADLNLDGDYDDAGEITVFYDDTVGSFALTNPVCVAMADDGWAYVGDSTEDIIIALRDNNGDGDALDPGEHRLFFDGVGNASGIQMASIQGLTIDLLGNMYAAVSNTSSVGDDMILKLVDLNMDGDANDAGEATSFFTRATAAVGDSIPTQVRVAPDGRIYFTEVGATGLFQKGVWQLFDQNLDGDANDPGEVSFFWGPPAPGNAFYWGLCIDRQGNLFVSDHGNETIWRARDLNGDNVITANEEQLYYQSTASTWWELLLRDDGTLVACEDQTPDRLTSFVDGNGDGDALDAGESGTVYDETTAVTFQVKPRAAAFTRGASLTVAPATVPLTQSGTMTVQTTKPGDLAILVFSPLQGSTVFRPFGTLGLSTAAVLDFAGGFSDAGSQFAVPFTVPNNPALVGTFYFQALSGDLFRLEFTNVVTLTVTP